MRLPADIETRSALRSRPRKALRQPRYPERGLSTPRLGAWRKLVVCRSSSHIRPLESSVARSDCSLIDGSVSGSGCVIGSERSAHSWRERKRPGARSNPNSGNEGKGTSMSAAGPGHRLRMNPVSTAVERRVPGRVVLRCFEIPRSLAKIALGWDLTAADTARVGATVLAEQVERLGNETMYCSSAATRQDGVDAESDGSQEPFVPVGRP